MAGKKPTRKTYKEFMSWIEGVECMQTTDWTPTTDQWAMIRRMLGNLKPEVIKETVEVEVEVQSPVQQPAIVHPRPLPVPASSFEPAVANPSVAPAGTVAPQRLVTPTLQENPSVTPGVPAATSTTADNNLDTSNGDYQSEFM